VTSNHENPMHQYHPHPPKNHTEAEMKEILSPLLDALQKEDEHGVRALPRGVTLKVENSGGGLQFRYPHIAIKGEFGRTPNDAKAVKSALASALREVVGGDSKCVDENTEAHAGHSRVVNTPNAFLERLSKIEITPKVVKSFVASFTSKLEEAKSQSQDTGRY